MVRPGGRDLPPFPARGPALPWPVALGSSLGTWDPAPCRERTQDFRPSPVCGAAVTGQTWCLLISGEQLLGADCSHSSLPHGQGEQRETTTAQWKPAVNAAAYGGLRPTPKLESDSALPPEICQGQLGSLCFHHLSPGADRGPVSMLAPGLS